MKTLLALIFWVGICFLILRCSNPIEERTYSVNRTGLKIIPMTRGIYHGAYPDIASRDVNQIAQKIISTENIMKKQLAFVSYDNDFVDGIIFPADALEQIRSRNKVPLVRMLPRSTREKFSGKDPVYSLSKFLKGEFDKELTEWALAAKKFSSPIILEFGPECNGAWYQWSGQWEGADEKTGYGDPNLYDGPEKYRDTYRHIFDLFKKEGVNNITWAFHVDTQPIPNSSWNAMVNYYPGDSYVDWIGASVYGAQLTGDWWGSFSEVLGEKWAEFSSISNERPLYISEWGVIEKPGDPMGKANWISGALEALITGKYPGIKAINYYHEHSYDGGPNNNFALDTSSQSLEAYNRNILNPLFLSEMQSVLY